MADFNWDQFPEEKQEDFNWDAHPVADVEPAEEAPAFTMKGLARGAIDALPYAAAVGGGALGTGLGPAGTVGGAGLGYAAGAEMSDFLKNRLLGDEAASTEPVEQLKRAGGNVMNGMSAEMGGQLLGKGLSAAGGAIANTVDDVATAPLGQAGERGMIAKGMDMAHRAGKFVNGKVDELTDMLTPTTGDKGADAMVKGATRIGSRVGRYGAAAPLQKAVDVAEYGPKVAQWAAGKASPLLEKAAPVGEYASGLAQRAPQVYNTLTQKMAEREKPKPYDRDAIMQKVQGTPYAQALSNASQRGEQAFNAAYFTLQSNPDFRQAMASKEEGTE